MDALAACLIGLSLAATSLFILSCRVSGRGSRLEEEGYGVVPARENEVQA
jgi:hypothetical protein